MKKVVCVLMMILMVVSLSGCFGLLSDAFSSLDGVGLSSSRYEIVGEPKMTVSSDSFGYSVDIKGTLKNTSKREFSYVSVHFALYDQDGNQIETAIDNMNYLQPGSTWTFDAVILGWADERPSTFKLVDVTAW